MHASSHARMAGLVDRYLSTRRGAPLRVLDVGSQDVNGSYRDLFTDPEWTYVGLDMAAGPGVDIVVTQPYRWKALRTGSFDVVVSGQAFEHIEFPWLTIMEMARVLRPGGLMFVIAPGAGPEHRFPFDCWRFYPDGMRALGRWADLIVHHAVASFAPEGWPDDSDDWCDAVLVAEKPVQRGLRRRLGDVKRGIIRSVGGFQAQQRRTPTEPPDLQP